MLEREVWDYSRLGSLQRQMWDAMKRAVEDGDLYTLVKFFLNKSKFEPRVHQSLGRFIMAPLLGKYDTKGMLYSSDYDESQPSIPRGTMRGGDPFGAPYYYVTRMSNPPSRRQLLLLPRASYKSTYMEALVIMVLLRNPNASVLLMSNDEDKAKDISNAVEQHLISNPKLIHYWHTDTWKTLAHERALTWTIEKKIIGVRTENRQDASIIVSSLGALKPGKHVDVVILDDIINEKTMASDVESAKVDETFDLIEHMLDDKSVQYVLGTRWGKLDLYESLETHKTSRGKYRYDVYGRDDVLPNGQLWFPEQHSEAMLLDKWESALRVGQPWIFWSQRRMQPISTAEQGLQIEKIHWYPNECSCGQPHPLPERLNAIVGIDPADEEGKDASGNWAIWAKGTDCDRRFWDLELTKARIKGDRAMDETVRMVKKYDARAVLVENTIISRRFIPALEEKLVVEGLGRVAVIPVEHHGASKQHRIMNVDNSVGTVMAQERLYLRKDNFIIKTELRSFPGGHYTYDALDILGYILPWCQANRYFPSQPIAAEAESRLPPEMVEAYKEADQALAERDMHKRVMLGHNIFVNV